MKTSKIPFIITLLLINILILSGFVQAAEIATDFSIDRAAEIADQKQKEAHEKAKLINDLYNKGRSHFNAKRYGQAKASFKHILDIDPAYEPAKLYLESVVIKEGVIEAQSRVEGFKLQMADILEEYDKRVKIMDSLAVRYFLEQAQEKCQLGNFKEAERLYGLCYKVYPYSKDKIEWFVKATYDLTELYSKLEEENRRIEELLASF